jgi:glycosyltransferase involved in cell wall biosynthesis/ubiquinone/menaquinone biosynthesis C-methylase UbiE
LVSRLGGDAAVRILKVVQSYYPFQEKGGTAVKVRALARGLARRGHEVTVLTADLGLRSHNGHGVRAERCDWGWRSVLDGIEAVYLPAFGRYRALTLNPRVIRFCRASLRGFDLVHFYGLYDMLGPVVSHYCRRQGVPYVIEPMGMFRPIDRGFRLKALWHRSMGQSFWRHAEQIIATSEMEQQELLEDGVPPAKLVVRYNGIEDVPEPSSADRTGFREKWGISRDEPLIIFLGRLIPRKGADTLIEAFARTCPDSGRLVVAGPEGEPGYQSYLRRRATECGVETRVIFPGPLYDSEKNALLADADLFVLPSRYENFANAAAESMAWGVPVIVTNSCGIRSLVEGQAGIVIEPDQMALTKAMRDLIHDRALYSRFQEGCRRVAQQLNWNRLTEQMEIHYSNAVRMANGLADSSTFYDQHPFDWAIPGASEPVEAVVSRPLIEMAEQLNPNSIVLDVGCGPGRFLGLLTHKGIKCIGLDRSHVSLGLAVKRYGAPGAVGDNLRLPFADGCIDVVISDGVIHHTDDPQAAFAENCRVLKHAGRMYLAVYKPAGRYPFLYKFPGRLIRSGLKRRWTQPIVAALAQLPYFLVHFVRSKGRRTWTGAQNLFYDYFVTPRVAFLSRAAVEEWCRQQGVFVEVYDENRGSNVHSFQLVKREPGNLLLDDSDAIASSEVRAGALP